MSKAFASIKRGLNQAIRHRKGKRVPGLKTRFPSQTAVKLTRERELSARRRESLVEFVRKSPIVGIALDMRRKKAGPA